MTNATSMRDSKLNWRFALIVGYHVEKTHNEHTESQQLSSHDAMAVTYSVLMPTLLTQHLHRFADFEALQTADKIAQTLQNMW